MADILLMQVRPGGLVPVTAADHETLKSYPVGTQVHASVSAEKRKRMEGFYWRLVQLTGDGVGIGKRPMSTLLLLKTGHVEEVLDVDGRDGRKTVHIVPRSIADMKHDEFKNYVDRAVELICEEYLALRPNELLQMAAKLAGISYEEAFETKRHRRATNG